MLMLQSGVAPRFSDRRRRCSRLKFGGSTSALASLTFVVVSTSSQPASVVGLRLFRKGLRHPASRSEVRTRTSQTAPQTAAAAATYDERSNKAQGNAPCACEAANPSWKRPSRTSPMCFFLDLGAGSGDSELAFLGDYSQSKTSVDGYGNKLSFDTAGYRSDQCLSYLVEPNWEFNQPLQEVAKKLPGKIFPMLQQAIYMCDKQKEMFYLDAGGPHARGSAIDSTHTDILKQGDAKKAVPVTLINLARWLQEGVLPDDHLVIKMDVEGAEWDILYGLPCLAQNPEVYRLIDVVYLENHCPGGQYCCNDGIHLMRGEAACDPRPPGVCWCPSKGQAGNTMAVYQDAIAKMQAGGVQFPPYFSFT